MKMNQLSSPLRHNVAVGVSQKTLELLTFLNLMAIINILILSVVFRYSGNNLFIQRAWILKYL